MLTSHALASKLQKAIIYEKTLDVLCCKSGDLIGSLILSDAFV